MDFIGKTIIITGSARGIGKAIAMKFAELGGNIVINDIEPAAEAASETVGEITAAGGHAAAILGSVAVPADAERLVNEAQAAFGSVDVLINNAGITRDNLIMRMTEEDWDAVLTVNLKGAFNCVKAATRVMMKQRSGVIVNVSSVVGLMGNPGQANYSASKAGLVGLTKSVAKEFASRNIRCNAVAPGFIQTAMTDALPDNVREDYLKAIPLRRFGTVGEIADVVAFLAGDESKYVTGQVIHIDGGLLM